jgi:hypothetical protein
MRSTALFTANATSGGFGLFNLPQLMLEARHHIFGGLHPAPFIKNFSLGLNDALLRGLALTTNMIYLLL